MHTFYSVFSTFLGVSLLCQPVLANEDEFFRNLSGCFKVTYRYVEDGKNDQTFDGVFEWIAPFDGGPETTLQHIGVDPESGVSFKHWREEWKENENGTWNQRVIGPYEDFRYECSAPIEFNQWRCLSPGAPKPRRDQARKDYKTLDRDNTLQVTSERWIQSEVNTKRDGNGKIVANEIGWNEYVRVPDENCKGAMNLMKKIGALSKKEN